jgi:hypothetical protein
MELAHITATNSATENDVINQIYSLTSRIQYLTEQLQ